MPKTLELSLDKLSVLAEEVSKNFSDCPTLVPVLCAEPALLWRLLCQ
jgi:hypothetical protein